MPDPCHGLLTAAVTAEALGCAWVATAGLPPPLLLDDLRWIALRPARRVTGSRRAGWRENPAAAIRPDPRPGLVIARTPAELAEILAALPGPALIWQRFAGPRAGYRCLWQGAEAMLLGSRDAMPDPNSAPTPAPDLDALVTRLTACDMVEDLRFAASDRLQVSIDPICLLEAPQNRLRRAMVSGVLPRGRITLRSHWPMAEAMTLHLSGRGTPPPLPGFVPSVAPGGCILRGLPEGEKIELGAEGWRLTALWAEIALPAAWIDRRPIADPLAIYDADPFREGPAR